MRADITERDAVAELFERERPAAAVDLVAQAGSGTRSSTPVPALPSGGAKARIGAGACDCNDSVNRNRRGPRAVGAGHRRSDGGSSMSPELSCSRFQAATVASCAASSVSRTSMHVTLPSRIRNRPSTMTDSTHPGWP